MRALIVSSLLAGGMLILGGCATTPAEPSNLTLAERAEQCSNGSELVPTGRQTGDVRVDFRCKNEGFANTVVRRNSGEYRARDAGRNRALNGN